MASFGFRVQFHNKIGIFMHDGYLVDPGGYRLSLSVVEVNYNDIFCSKVKGQEMFEELLEIFEFRNRVLVG